MEKWYVELNKFHIENEPKTAIKGQVLANFIAEFTDSPTGPTGGQPEATVAPIGQPIALTRGQGDMDMTEINNAKVQQSRSRPSCQEK